MTYYTLSAIKKNLEILPSDDTLNTTLDEFGAEGDAYVDSLLGNSTPLTNAPTIVKHAASNYAAGRYRNRLTEDSRGKALMEDATNQIMHYKKSLGRVTVWG